MIKNEIIEKLRVNTYIDAYTGCFLWKGSLDDDGYGMIRNPFEDSKSNMIRVHRLSAIIYLELDINDRTQKALHKSECPNKNCWNALHLYVGTNQDNILDAVKKGTHYIPTYIPPKGRKIGTHCTRGHELNEKNLALRKNGSWYCRICANMLKRGEVISVYK